MAERIQTARPIADEVTTETTRVVEHDAAGSHVAVRPMSTAARLVWFITGILLILLAFRFVLILLGANPNNQFANFIYTISYPFAVPFFGLFGYSIEYGIARVELSTLIAMAVYALVGYGIARLLTIDRA